MRSDKIIATMPDTVREAAKLPPVGAYYVGSAADNFGQNADESIINSNQPPSGQPGLWCQWVPSSDGTAIEWDGGEKFYDYTEWIIYLIEQFLKPWGYILNGEVEWQGQSRGDIGRIVVTDNAVERQEGTIHYGT